MQGGLQGSEGEVDESELGGTDASDDGEGDSGEAAEAVGSLNPVPLGLANVGVRAFPQISLLPGHDLCSCHENPFFIYDSTRMDCFDPWHQQTVAECDKMCACHGEHYFGGWVSKLGKCVNLTTAMQTAPNETQRLQRHVGSDDDAQIVFDLMTSLPSCIEADLTCIDDPTYRDIAGESCDFYATLPDPLVACAFPGYRQALTRCPSACGTCDMVQQGWQEGDVVDTDGDGVADVDVVDNPHEGWMTLSNDNQTETDGPIVVGGYSVFHGADEDSKLFEVNLRYFDVLENVRPICPARDNLHGTLHVSRYATRERCARECASFTLSTLDDPSAEKCIGFSFTQVADKTAGTSNGLSSVCEFMSDVECTTEKYLNYELDYTTYVLKTDSDCDPLPASPLYLDGCGVCGGDNRTCASSLELIVGSERVAMATHMPTLGSVVAGGKLFPNAYVHHGETLAQLRNQSRLLSKHSHRRWDHAQVYCILELYGAKGHSHELLASYGKDDLVFSFGSHPSGNTAEFLLAQPTSEEIGELERVQLTVIGGEHWLDGTNGRAFEGIRLILTVDMQRLLWTLPLRMGTIHLDETTTFTWHFGAHGHVLPTSMRKCHPDCTRSALEQPENSDDEHRTLGAFAVETDRNGMRVVTEPLRRNGATLDGCTERCTTTYEMVSEVDRDTRGGRREDCTPDPTESALCPNLYYPVCGADGRTYRNSCVSTALCAIVHHLGSCGVGRDATFHSTLQARRMAHLHEFYSPEGLDAQHGIFPGSLEISDE